MNTINLFITIFYWTILFNGSYAGETTKDSISDATHHTVPLITVTIDTLWNKNYKKYIHISAPLIVSFVYMFVNMILALGYDDVVYNVLNWKGGGTVGYLALSLTLVVLSGLLVVFVKQK